MKTDLWFPRVVQSISVNSRKESPEIDFCDRFEGGLWVTYNKWTSRPLRSSVECVVGSVSVGVLELVLRTVGSFGTRVGIVSLFL